MPIRTITPRELREKKNTETLIYEYGARKKGPDGTPRRCFIKDGHELTDYQCSYYITHGKFPKTPEKPTKHKTTLPEKKP